MGKYAGEKTRIVVIGGGFGGAYAAQELAHRASAEVEIVLVDRNNFLLFYPLLIEAGVGQLEPRHVTVPIRSFLKKRAKFILAEVESVDLDRQVIQMRVASSEEPTSLPFDQLVLAPGSSTRIPPIPGLAEFSFELKSLQDSIEFRDRGIRLLELANTMDDEEERRAILRIVIVGSNFTGIELAGEYQEFLTDQVRNYPNLSEEDIEVLIVEYSDRILPAIDADLALFARRHLERRGLKIRTRCTLTEVRETEVVLTSGETVRTHTTVWCAGIAPSPLLSKIPGLPLNERGYVVCTPDMQVSGRPNVWAIGDSAFVPDENGHPYTPTAQNASRQGPAVARNILRSLEGEATQPFRFNPMGSLAAIGCRTAVARIMGIKLHGFPAWFLFRTIYLMKMPSWSRRIRIMIDWTLSLFFRQEPVQLGVRDR